METLRDRLTAGRLAMRDAFIEMCEVAARAGADWDVVSGIQHRFFDGNEAVNVALAEEPE